MVWLVPGLEKRLVLYISSFESVAYPRKSTIGFSKNACGRLTERRRMRKPLKKKTIVMINRKENQYRL